ncbi:DUF4091 domain-containing protein [Desmonostoc muscorum LEGE 12446]|uniref:DUF4091 domain-containing protein n=1 Tax=Desmonostoc muscorum LEGE 12446 TaxID=1828758 RepID=A0A8J7CY31_DESMC|nr:DUF4091 domain-containing protein [Desmonostoc muscorum]MCF2147307.1 DUF4091 domain-containing protein [Desmonostoc muscorum LEGE 12446]
MSLLNRKTRFVNNIKLILGILATVFTLFACSTIGLLANNPSLGDRPFVWVASNLERINQKDPPGTKTEIDLYAARGEYEPFQIAIRAPNSGLTNVNVVVSDLSASNNRIISNTNITLYREHYVRVTHSSPNKKGSTNLSLGTGWYADGLIPFINPENKKDIKDAELDAVPFNLKAGNNQPIWVDIFVPRGTQTGDYQGTFTVTSDQGAIAGKIHLKVWNFELPIKPSLSSEFTFYEHQDKSDMIELLKHKLMPDAHFNPADEPELINQWGLGSRGLPFWSGANVSTCKMAPAPSLKKIKTTAAKHESRLFLYARYADEIDNCANLIEPVKQWARNFHQAGIATALAMTPTPTLYDDGSGTGRSAVDIWVVLPESYDEAPERITEVLQKGDKVWSYNALVQDGYSPKWQIDFEPINYRIHPGFISQSLGITGILYWRVDLWTKDPWKDVQTYFQKKYKHYFPGEGMLFYPGKQVGIKGVVPSIRLKWLREGVEDYEYLEILKNRHRQHWAFPLARRVGLDWKHWTRDTNLLESVRRQLGEEIHRLSSQ